MIKYTGQSSKAKIRITIPDGVTYTYTLFGNEYRSFPLSGGDGIYQITVYKNVQDDMYAVVNSQTLNVSLTDEFVPFLYPNYYSWYTAETEAVQLGIQLSSHTYNDLEYLCEVYDYIISNITYDQELADSGPVDYVPDVDRALNTGKGICFDYAALMTSMLRSQGIPTKLEVGYSGFLPLKVSLLCWKMLRPLKKKLCSNQSTIPCLKQEVFIRLSLAVRYSPLTCFAW